MNSTSVCLGRLGAIAAHGRRSAGLPPGCSCSLRCRCWRRSRRCRVRRGSSATCSSGSGCTPRSRPTAASCTTTATSPSSTRRCEFALEHHSRASASGRSTTRATSTSPRSSASLRPAASLLSDDDQRIKNMWGAEGIPRACSPPIDSIRFQLGQSDRFREGLVRSGAWASHIAEVFANQGLPAELAVLPHVESSFNPAAYSKVGAAGLWQFMRSTGRRYMRIDNAIDDRTRSVPLDRSGRAASGLQLPPARHLAARADRVQPRRRRHAPSEGRRWARTTSRSIVRNYKSPSFGFASRNFYVSFLAALEIDRNPEKYFEQHRAAARSEVRRRSRPRRSSRSARSNASLKVERAAAAQAQSRRCCRRCGTARVTCPRAIGCACRPAARSGRRSCSLSASRPPSSTPVSRRIGATRFARARSMASIAASYGDDRSRARRAQRTQRRTPN